MEESENFKEQPVQAAFDDMMDDDDMRFVKLYIGTLVACSVATGAFIVLKLIGVLTISWWWIVCPAFVPAVSLVGIVAALCVVLRMSYGFKDVPAQDSASR